MSIINQPLPFPGSDSEGEANYDSHRWVSEGGDVCCIDCDVKPHHTSADWPCRINIPRTVMTTLQWDIWCEKYPEYASKFEEGFTPCLTN